ncbi:MAG: MATE family efflux transporter [Ignavibacteria bacterium]|nr:MATE family efflux transporter [Ignavibacteria bacterium]
MILPDKQYFRTILRIALPAIAGLSTQMVLSLVDAAMVGRLDNPEYTLAAMGIGVLATWAVVSFFSSLATGTHVLTANSFGEKNYPQIGKILQNSIYVGFFIGLIVTFLGIFFSEPFAQLFAKDPNVGRLAGEFIYFRLLGLPLFLITVSYRGFYFGIGNTKIFMISGILTNLLNIVFNYILIYGEFGLPAMGVAGSGLGSTLATLFDASFYFFFSLNAGYRVKYFLYRRLNFSLKIIRSLYKISLPVSFQNVFILIGFLSFISITGLIGLREQAASQAIVSVLFISFLPCFGFGIAAQTLVGNSLGASNFFLARKYAFETAKIATLYTLSLSFIYVFFPKYLLNLITNEQPIIATAVPAMRIAGVAQIFYGIGVVLANTLQASGKSMFVMIAEVVSNILIFVPVAYILGVYFHFGIVGAWIGLPIYILIYASMVFIKFRFGK